MNLPSKLSLNDSIAKSQQSKIGETYAFCIAQFNELNATERLQLLKALGGALGHRVLPGLGLGNPQPGVPLVRQRVKAPVQRQSRKSAKQVEIETKIKTINDSIKVESSRIGQRLNGEHPLIQERYQLFRAMQEFKAGHDHGPMDQGREDP